MTSIILEYIERLKQIDNGSDELYSGEKQAIIDIITKFNEELE